MLVAQLHLTLWNSMDCSPPGSSVYGILQARILEWVATSSSRGSSQSRDENWVSCPGGWFFTIWASRVYKKWCQSRASLSRGTRVTAGTHTGDGERVWEAQGRGRTKRQGPSAYSSLLIYPPSSAHCDGVHGCAAAPRSCAHCALPSRRVLGQEPDFRAARYQLHCPEQVTSLLWASGYFSEFGGQCISPSCQG